MNIEDRKEYLRNYNREWIRKRRAAYFAGKVCAKCGSASRLELDHIDPSLKESHSIWSWSEERRNKELLKCQVLCYNCHKEKTIRENSSLGRKPSLARKLTKKEVEEIEASSLSLRKLAKLYGSNHTTIKYIKQGKRYKNYNTSSI